MGVCQERMPSAGATGTKDALVAAAGRVGQAGRLESCAEGPGVLPDAFPAPAHSHTISTPNATCSGRAIGAVASEVALSKQAHLCPGHG